ncbi:hypothetical protein [Phaeodactylibacter xiamenensis]|uniref:hypothetical protein n=1 Tax=Phaeodactylibacter xiamenensis TaxID=1524460 RepID=UPI0024A89FC3|nr:hypothetical protein [Phaeodactylibacter xiamenensis]
MKALRKASTLDDVYQAFRGEPLRISEMEEFYQKTKPARGTRDPRQRIARLLKKLPDSYEHFLFVGYKGCGKSTELNHLQMDISHQFLVLNYSVQDELDPVHLNYIELFIVTMEKLFTVADEKNLSIRQELIDSIQNWMVSEEVKEIREKYNISVEGEVGAEGKIGIPYLKSFFAKFRATAKSSRQLKETLKRNIEPKLSDLIEHCNNLIREISFKLDEIGLKDMVIIIEDLDKIPLQRAEDLFFNYTNQLTQLQTNVIFTFPIALYYHVRFNDIKNYFSDPYELPMIKIKNRDGSENEVGMQVMRDIVSARMDTDTLFGAEELLDQLIRKSGGCIRDLFLMIQEAAESALDLEREAILNEDVALAIQRLKNEYDNNIADNIIDGEKYSADLYYKVLVELHNSETKKVDNTLPVMHLRQNLCILGYNGEGWTDVHPVVVDILRERKRIDE